MKKKLLGALAAFSIVSVFMSFVLPFRATAQNNDCTYEVGYMIITCLGETSWCVIPYPDNPILCVGNHAIIKELEIQDEP